MNKIVDFFKQSKYRLFLLLYSLVLVVVIVASLSVLWVYLSEYEDLKAEKVITSFLAETKDEYWEGLIEERYSLKTTEFENADTVINKLNLTDISSDKMLFYKSVKEYTADKPVYTLYFNNREFAKITLKPVKKYILGLVKWDIDEVELSLNDSEANSVAVNVAVPPGSVVKLNGITVGKKYISDERFEFEDILPFEKGVDGVPYRTKYTIKGLFDLPEVTVFDKDNNSLPVDIHGYDYSVGTKTTKKHDIKISCPDGYTAKINGILVDETYLVEKNTAHDFMSDVVGFSGQLPAMKLYEIKGFYTTPDVRVYDEEKKEVKLDQNTNGKYFFDFQSSESAKTDNIDLVSDFLKAYFKYTADGYTNIDANYSNVLSYVLGGSSAAKVIGESYNGVVWNNTYRVIYNKLEIDNFVMYGDTAFSCDVVYDTIFTCAGYEHPRVGAFKLVFVKSGNTYKLSKMINR